MRQSRQRTLCLVCSAFFLTTAGCLNDGAAGPPTPSDPSARSQQIAALEESIDRDRRRLEELVTEPRSESEDALHSDAVLREIVERITAESNRLERLRNESGKPARRN